MGAKRGLYSAEFPTGTKVKIESREVLEDFAKNWAQHNLLQAHQLQFHDVEAVVEEVGFYHEADELYKLSQAPGIWHGQCLKDASITDEGTDAGRKGCQLDPNRPQANPRRIV